MMKRQWVGVAACMAALSSAVDGASAQDARARFAPLTEDQLTAEQRAIPSIKRALAEGRYNPSGFDAVMARNPGLQDAVHAMGAQVFPHIAAATPGGGKPTLKPVLSELAVLQLSSEWGFPAMFRSHGPLALQAGASQATVDALARGERPGDMTPEQAAVYDFTAELLRTHAVSDAAFAEARRFLSERDIVDLVGILGVYTTSLMMLKVAGASSH